METTISKIVETAIDFPTLCDNMKKEYLNISEEQLSNNNFLTRINNVVVIIGIEGKLSAIMKLDIFEEI